MKKILLLIIFLNFGINIVCPMSIAQENDEYRFLMLFSNILNHVKSNYYEKIPVEMLYKGAIDGILGELDPHTQYLSPYNFNRFQDISQGLSFGVGIEFEIIDNQPIVISVIQGSPADKKNIKTGDILLQIDGKKIPAKISTADLLFLLYGEKDSAVKLKFQRKDSFISTTIKRDKLVVNSIVISTMLGSDIGYIKCTNFSQTTIKEFEKATKELLKSDANYLIIDLRNNPGGILESAIKVADLFLAKGKKIVSTTGRKEEIIANYTAADDNYFGIPLLLLINNGTASASEILAGCFQDHNRAKIVGTTSFGKGLIQSTFLMDNGGALLMTIGEYRTPNGRKIQRNYKNKSFQDYFEHYGNQATSSSNSNSQQPGGIHPDIYIERDIMLDSLDYSDRYNQFITKKAVELITECKIDKQYNSYTEFKISFHPDTLTINESLTRDQSFVQLLQISIKAEIAGILWGEHAKFDCKKNIDNQLESAINSFN